MAAGFFKRNEKVLMTLLLLVLAPAFAFTGIMTWYFTQGRLEAQGIYEIFGRTYSRGEFIERRDELSKQVLVNTARLYGPFFNPRRVGATEEGTLEYLMQLHEVERLGLRPSGQQEQEALREAALDVLTWYRIMEERGWQPTFQEARTAYIAEREAAVFNADLYRRAVTGGRLGMKMTIAEFEEAVRDTARVGMLSRIVGNLPFVSDKELYDEYCLDRQKRHFDYVQISSERFLEDAKAQVDEEYLRGVYDDNPVLYRKEAAFKLRVAKAIRDQFIDPDFDPDLEAIQERYERDKTSRYKVGRPPGWEPPPDHDPESDYRALPEVFELVVKSLADDDAKEKEQEFLKAAIEKTAELAATGEEWTLEDAFPEEDRNKIFFEDLDWFTVQDISTIDRNFQNFPALRGLFTLVDPTRVGEVSPEPVSVSTGNYIYRIAGIEEARPMTFEEAVADITVNAEKQRAKELTAEYLETWVERIRDEEGTNLATFASEENYTIHTTENPLGQFEGYMLRIDEKPVIAGSQLVRELFAQTEDIGQVTDPVFFDRDDNVYIAEVRELVAPDMKDWTVARPGLEARIRQRRQTALVSQFRAELERRAQITPLWDPADDEEGG